MTFNLVITFLGNYPKKIICNAHKDLWTRIVHSGVIYNSENIGNTLNIEL